MTIDIDELLPCPFCGCEVELVLDHTVELTDWIRHKGTPCGVEFSGQRGEVIAAWNSRPSAIVEEPMAGEATCECCGGPALTWFAPNPLWNLVQGGPDATDDPGGMLCPNCFIRKAEAAGIIPTAWVLDRENLAFPQPHTGRAGVTDEMMDAAIAAYEASYDSRYSAIALRKAVNAALAKVAP